MMYLYVAFSNHLILNVFIYYNDEDAILQSNQRQIAIRKAIIHLVPTQNFPIILHFLPPDTQEYVCVSGGKK